MAKYQCSRCTGWYNQGATHECRLPMRGPQMKNIALMGHSKRKCDVLNRESDEFLTTAETMAMGFEMMGDDYSD